MPAAVTATQQEALVVSQDAAWPPFSYLDDAGEPRGLLIDLWRAIGERSGTPIRFRLVDWNESLEALKSGEADLHGGLFESLERREYLDFSNELLPLGASLFVSSWISVSSLEELPDLAVGVTRGGYEESFLRQHYPTLELAVYPNNQRMVEAALAGEILAFVADYPVGMFLLHQLDAKEAFHGVSTLYTNTLMAAVPKGEVERLDWINTALAALDGHERERIIQKWIGRDRVVPDWFYPFVGLLVGLWLVGALVAWFVLLKRQVRQRTLQLEREIAEREQAETRIRESERSYHGLFNAFTDSVCIHDENGELLEVNDATTRIFGHPREWFSGKTPFDCAARGWNDEEALRDTWRDVLAGGQAQLLFWGRRADGARFPKEVRLSPTLYRGRAAIVAIGHDISERYGAEQELIESRKRFLRVVSEMPVLFEAFDDRNRILFWNDECERVTGYSAKEMIGNPDAVALLHPDEAERERVMNAIEKQQGDFHNLELDITRKDGTRRTISWTNVSDASPIPGWATWAVGYDVTELHENRARLEHLAFYDPLTGLANRLMLTKALTQAMATAHRRANLLAVCYLDLDCFKPINDGYGHEAGDQLLKQVAERIRANIRTEDAAARLGGDEFVILLGDLEGAAECSDTLARLLAVLAEPYAVDGKQHRVSASIGVTLYPDDDASGDTLLRHADQAMYRAKQLGRNRYHFFDLAQDQQAHRRSEQLARLDQALGEGELELELYYQPQIDMRRGEIHGVEALVRWHHPDAGLLLPGDFLPALEGHPLALKLDLRVCELAFRQIQAWREQGIELGVSINLSAQTLRQPDLLERLDELFARYPGVKPENLSLEVLEGAALGDIAQVSGFIEACAQRGVTFAIDDFGAGYTSLAYFRRLPAKVLKIDRVFVSGMLENEEDMHIVQGIVGLARTFERMVIAEGVESPMHGAVLLQMGCDLAQGYGLAEPMPAETLPAWLEGFHPHPIWSRSAMLRLSREDMALLTAETEHRRWVEQVRRWLVEGEDESQRPALALRECGFGRWYHGARGDRYGGLEAYRQLGEVHLRVHQLAERLIHAAPLTPEAQASGLQELSAARDELLGWLHRLQAEVMES